MEPVGADIVDDQKDRTEQPRQRIDPVDHVDRAEIRHRDGDERHAHHAPENQHRQHRDRGLARAAQHRRETVRGRQQEKEDRTDLRLSDTEGDRLRLLGEGADQIGRGEIDRNADQLRRRNGTENAEAGALLGPVVFARAQILAHKGGQRHLKAGDRQEGEALDLGIGAAAGDGHGAEGVDVGLYHDVGNGDDRVLQAGGQTVAYDQHRHLPVKADLPDHDPVAVVRSQKLHGAEDRADELSQDRGQRGARHAQREHRHKQQVQHHVQSRGDDQVHQRAAAVAHGTHDAAQGIVHHQPHGTGEEHTDIGDGQIHHVLRRAHEPQQPGRQRRSRRRQHQADHQVEGHRGVDRKTHLFLVPRTEIARSHHTGAHGNAAEKADEQEDKVACGADGGKRVIADKISHDQRVGCVIELLKQIPDKNRHCKADHLAADAALGHQKLRRMQHASPQKK